MQVIIIISVVFVILLIIYSILSMLNPRSKEKFYNKQIKIAKNIMDENEDVLREISTKEADISSKGLEIQARAIV